MRNYKTRDNKEYIYTREPTWQPGRIQVKDQDRYNSNCSQSIYGIIVLEARVTYSTYLRMVAHVAEYKKVIASASLRFILFGRLMACY